MKKMSTPSKLYLECLDDNLQQISIPRIGYKISMDSRMKAAQATIHAFFLRNCASRKHKNLTVDFQVLEFKVVFGYFLIIKLPFQFLFVIGKLRKKVFVSINLIFRMRNI